MVYIVFSNGTTHKFDSWQKAYLFLVENPKYRHTNPLMESDIKIKGILEAVSHEEARDKILGTY